MSKDLKTLLEDIRACNHCAEMLPAGPRPVVQMGTSAKILIAGQAPGSKVHETGIPFDDPSGDRLRDWMGIDKTVFYDSAQIAILPMGFCYPGKGKSGDLPPRPECADKWRERALQALPNVELVLVIGQYSTAYHLAGRANRNLTETVKNWQVYYPETMPLPHPSPRNNIWLKKNPWFQSNVLPPLRKRVGELLDKKNEI